MLNRPIYIVDDTATLKSKASDDEQENADQDAEMLRQGDGKNFESPRSDLSPGSVSNFIDKFDDNQQILRGSYSSDSLECQIP